MSQLTLQNLILRFGAQFCLSISRCHFGGSIQNRFDGPVLGFQWRRLCLSSGNGAAAKAVYFFEIQALMVLAAFATQIRARLCNENKALSPFSGRAGSTAKSETKRDQTVQIESLQYNQFALYPSCKNCTRCSVRLPHFLILQWLWAKLNNPIQPDKHP